MTPLLTVRDLVKSYAQGSTTIEVLKGLNLQLNRGESLAVVGQSGSGKSTLLSLLAGLDRPNTGSISIGERNMAAMSEEELAGFRARQLSIIFQQFHLIASLTALENVSLPLEIRGEKNALAQAEQALADVGLSHRAQHRPFQLSGGESQRVAIARAFVSQPELLLADEPSGNLDDETGEKVMDLLFSMVAQKNMTMILVTHDHELAGRCHSLMHLRHGVLSPS